MVTGEVTVATTAELIVTNAVSVAVELIPSVMRTEYVVVEVGHTTIDEVVCPDGFHAYVKGAVPPVIFAVMVAQLPEQTLVPVVATVTLPQFCTVITRLAVS